MSKHPKELTLDKNSEAAMKQILRSNMEDKELLLVLLPAVVIIISLSFS
jgi:hypothetical protein